MTTGSVSGTRSSPGDASELCNAVIEQSPYPMAVMSGLPPVVLSVNAPFSLLFAECASDLHGMPFCTLLCDPHAALKRAEEVLTDGCSAVFREQRSYQNHLAIFTYALWPLEVDQIPHGMMVQVTTSDLENNALAMSEALLIGSLRHQVITEKTEALNLLLHADIQERKQVEIRLRELREQLSIKAVKLEDLVRERTKELTEINKELEYFVYAIAHDLRAPLRAVQGFTSVLTKEIGKNLSERANWCATRIDKAARFMDSLLIDLLTFSQISKQRTELSRVKLKPLVEAVLAQLHGDIEEKHVQEIHSGAWPDVWAHELTLHQVLYNLTSNAIKFNNPGITPRLKISTETREEIVRIWIEDNGIGIAPEHHAQIFVPFIRLNGERYSGTGIGLAIVKKGIERMGGRVGLESNLGRGTRFWIELKRATEPTPVEHEINSKPEFQDAPN